MYFHHQSNVIERGNLEKVQWIRHAKTASILEKKKTSLQRVKTLFFFFNHALCITHLNALMCSCYSLHVRAQNSENLTSPSLSCPWTPGLPINVLIRAGCFQLINSPGITNYPFLFSVYYELKFKQICCCGRIGSPRSMCSFMCEEPRPD